MTFLNPNLTSEGLSAENMDALVVEMGASDALVRDSVKLVKRLEARGAQTIFRAAGDDPAASPLGQDAAAFARARIFSDPDHPQVAIPSRYIHSINEIGLDADGIDDWTKANALEAEQYGKRIVAYNAATNEPLDAWKRRRDTILWLRDRGHGIGIHVYLGTVAEQRAGALAPLDFLAAQDVDIFVTEFAFFIDADNGYRGVMDEDQLNDWLDQNLPLLVRPKTKVYYFSVEHWHNNAQGIASGFGIIDKPKVIRHFAVLNAREWGDTGMATTYDLSEYIIPAGKPYVLVGVGANPQSETCQSQRLPNGYGHFVKNDRLESIWFDAKWIYRGVDTSVADDIYAQYSGDRYGAVWCKRYMTEGEVVNRSPNIRRYDASGNVRSISEPVSSQFRLAKHHDIYTTPVTQIELHDVVELEWLNGVTVVERYFYARGLGLVKFGTPGIPDGYASEVGSLNAPAPSAYLPAWFVEPVPPPVETAVLPAPPTGLANPIDTKPTTGLNVRLAPGLQGQRIDGVDKGEAVTVYATPVTPLDGYRWAWIKSKDGAGYVALGNESEDYFDPVVVAPDPPAGTAAITNYAIKLRSSPGTTGNNVIRTLAKGTAVAYFAEPLISADGYVWVGVEAGSDRGYSAVATSAGEAFAPAVPRPLPPDEPKFTIISPLPGGVITARFNQPRDYDGDGIFDDKHEGADWALPKNPCAIGAVHVVAVADGVVDSVRAFPEAKALGKLLTGYGVYVKVRHEVGSHTYVSWYCHLSAELVCKGQVVKQGDPVGILGTTGNSTGFHVHLNIQDIGRGLSGYVVSDVVDPMDYLTT